MTALLTTTTCHHTVPVNFVSRPANAPPNAPVTPSGRVAKAVESADRAGLWLGRGRARAGWDDAPLPRPGLAAGHCYSERHQCDLDRSLPARSAAFARLSTAHGGADVYRGSSGRCPTEDFSAKPTGERSVQQATSRTVPVGASVRVGCGRVVPRFVAKRAWNVWLRASRSGRGLVPPRCVVRATVGWHGVGPGIRFHRESTWHRAS